MKQYIEPRKS